MKALSRHLPLITNRIAFQLDDASKTLPLITPRINFSDALIELQNDTTEMATAADILEDPRGIDDLLSTTSDVLEMSPCQSEKTDDCAYSSTTWRIPKPNGEPGRPRSGGYNLEEELGAWEADLLASINVGELYSCPGCPGLT